MIRHLSWSFALRWGTRGLTFVRLAILARLLSPGQFGQFAIGTLVLAFLEIVSETWINVFLIQEKNKIDKYISSAWIISILRGVLISLVLLLSSSAIANFFNSPESRGLLVLLSLVPLLRGFINPSVVNFQRNLLFREEFFYKLFIFTTESLITICIAILTSSALSLVVGMLFGAALELFLSHLLFSPRPTLTFSKVAGREILQRGKWLSAAGIFNYLYQNTDNLVVGRLLGSASLGIYDFSYKLSSSPITEIGDVFAKVSLPVYVRLLGTPKLLKKTFFRNSILVSLGAAVISLTLFLFSDPFISLFLGPQWLQAIPIVQVLAVYGFSKAVVGTTFPLFLAVKKQSYITIIALISILGLGLSILPLITKFGIIGAGISASLGTLLSLPITMYLLSRTLKLLK